MRCEDALPALREHTRQDSGGPDQRSRNFIRWTPGPAAIVYRAAAWKPMFILRSSHFQKLQRPATQLIRGVFGAKRNISTMPSQHTIWTWNGRCDLLSRHRNARR
jgi:hypothetical protein